MNADEDLESGSDADFDSGFAAETSAPEKKTTPEPAPTPAVAATEESKPAATPEASGAETTPAAPEYVQITKAEWEEMRAAAIKTAGYDAQLAKLNGTLGSITANLNKAKEKPAADATGTAPKDGQPAAQEDDPATKAIVAHEKAALTALYPTWRDIVGLPDQDGNLPDNDFRKWLATQPQDYQHVVNSTNSSLVISRAIEKFEAFKAKPPAPKPPAAQAARKEVLRGNVQPKGDGGQPPSAKTLDDAFEQGFAAERN